jgi:Flp pilus assembly protein TadG
MRKAWREQGGAALVEYVTILPMLLLLFLGTLEIFRLISIKQSLRTGVKQALPCVSHWKDTAYRRDYNCSPVSIRNCIIDELKKNPFAPEQDVQLTITTAPDLNSADYGQPVRLRVDAQVKLGFIYFIPGRDTATIVEYADTFMDASPDYLGLNLEVPLPAEPGGY